MIENDFFENIPGMKDIFNKATGNDSRHTELKVVKSEVFGNIQCDFYWNKKDEVFMTAKQLGAALEYADPIRAISKVVSRNQYLENTEFSVVARLTTTDGKSYNTRVFTEDGIYEVTMLAGTVKAQEFRGFVRKILKELRKTDKYNIRNFQQQEIIKEISKLQADLEEREMQLMDADVNTANYRKCYRNWLIYRNTLKEVIKATRDMVTLKTKELSKIQIPQKGG